MFSSDVFAREALEARIKQLRLDGCERPFVIICEPLQLCDSRMSRRRVTGRELDARRNRQCLRSLVRSLSGLDRPDGGLDSRSEVASGRGKERAALEPERLASDTTGACQTLESIGRCLQLIEVAGGAARFHGEHFCAEKRDRRSTVDRGLRGGAQLAESLQDLTFVQQHLCQRCATAGYGEQG